MSELDSAGFYHHISDQFTVNEKFYAHESKSIASGFLTSEQSPISLFDKLIEMQNEINALKEQIAGTLGELAVKIQYEDGTVESVQNGTVKQIFAGYYTDDVADLQIKKGHIVTKTFKILLENEKATPLELISRLAGDRKTTAFTSTANSAFGANGNQTTVDSEVADDSYYLSQGKYDMVPVLYQNTTAAEFTSTIYLNEAPTQSAQLKGQFIYSRYKDVSNSNVLYTTQNEDSADTSGAIAYEYGMYDILTASVTGGPAESFIWTGTWDVNDDPVVTTPSILSTAGVTYNNNIFLHGDHPDINGLSSPVYNNVYASGANHVQSKAAKVNGIQTAYFYDNSLARTTKMAFEPNDQYLLGGKSCGAYLFLSPLSIDSIVVDADNTSGKYLVKNGENNAVAIDVVFQYRMTDYGGASESSLGFVGGIATQPISNLTYSKRIGLDILDSANNKFSFDLEVFAKYTA